MEYEYMYYYPIIPQEFHLHNNYPVNPIHAMSDFDMLCIGLLTSATDTISLYCKPTLPTVSCNNFLYYIMNKNRLFMPLDGYTLLHQGDIVKHIPGNPGEYKVHIFDQYKYLFRNCN